MVTILMSVRKHSYFFHIKISVYFSVHLDLYHIYFKWMKHRML